MDEEGRNRSTVVLVALGVLAVVVTAAVIFLKAGKPKMVAAPTQFSQYTAADKSFMCLSPSGWQTAGGASHGVMGGAVFKNGPVKIDITADLAGSLMGDIAKASDNMASNLGSMVPGLSVAAQKPPVEKLHEADKKSFESRLKEYQEGPMGSFQSQAGDARYSEYTANAGFRMGKVHGYRVTILGAERRITVVCQCPEANWATMQPAFQRVIGSLTPGGG